MKPNLLLAVFLCCLPASAAEPPINELLRDALYSEEVTRDTEAAAKQYEEVVSRYASQRQFAATAIFRLAEVRRKQGRKDEAIGLYQRLVTEFPESEAQVGLAKENLTAMGGTMPDLPKAESDNYETEKIAEIGRMMTTSPDVATGPENFSFAINQGSVRVMAYLLEKGGDPNTLLNGDTTPLPAAVSHGHLAICELLIKAGAKLNPDTRYTPLVTAVDQGHLKIADLLLKSGADVNFTPPSFHDLGTPLEVAIDKNNPAMIDKLLAAGANPNLAPDPRKNNFTPLHHAVGLRKLELIRALMEAGADPNIRTEAEFIMDNQVSVKPGDTALDMAAASGSTEILKLLLPKADASKLPSLLYRAVSASSVATAKLLLDAKVDPNHTDPNGNPPLVIVAANSGNPEMLEALLDHGADPLATFLENGYRRSALRMAVGSSRGDRGLRVVELLLNAGATPEEEWLGEFTGNLQEQSYRMSSKARTLIIEKFVIPSLVTRPAVTLLFTVGTTGTTQLARGPQGTPDSLAQLLLGSGNPIQWPWINTTVTRYPEKAAIWRKAKDGTNGTTRIWTGTLRQTEDFPTLEWGDVVQLSFSPEDEERMPPPSFTQELPQAVEWNLRKRISFPIKVEMDGKVLDYTMRGDRLMFDPTKRELPMMSARDLSSLLWPAGYSRQEQDNVHNIKASVSRDGWPDIQIADLRAGDQVKIRLPGREAQVELNARKREIVVRAAGMPGMKSWEVPSGTNAKDGITLTQILSELLSFSPLPENEAPPKDKIVDWYFTWAGKAGARCILWNNPDLSDVVIRRLKPDDSEEILHIDLATVIGKSTGFTAADAREADIPLQAGDLIELKLRPDTEGKVWKGLSEQEEAFFAKALGGAVQFIDQNEKVFVRQLAYEALEYLPTEAGKLPMRKESHKGGCASMTVRAIFGLQNGPTQNRLTRGGKKLPESLILRDGDQVSIGQTRLLPKAPNPRVMPIPPSR